MSFAEVDLSEVFTQVYAQCTIIICESCGENAQFLDDSFKFKNESHLCVPILSAAALLERHTIN